MIKNLLIVTILLGSIMWQPIHHQLMTSGISMTPSVHSLVTMFPFLVALLLLGRRR